MTITNTKETVQNTARGTRKVTSVMEETVVLPKYRKFAVNLCEI